MEAANCYSLFLFIAEEKDEKVVSNDSNESKKDPAPNP